MAKDKGLPQEPVTTKVGRAGDRSDVSPVNAALTGDANGFLCTQEGSRAFRALNFELYAVRTPEPPPILSTFPHNFRYQVVRNLREAEEF